MGTSYKGGADYYHNVSENLGNMKDKYSYKNGFFGEKGDSKDSSIRHIYSDDPSETAKEFYDDLAYGGVEKTLYYKDGSVKGYQTHMADGTIINWRKVSSSDGSPAVDIDVQYSNEHGDIVTQKIHFVKTEE